MKKTGLLAVVAMAVLTLTSCDSKVEVNGEKIELADGIYAKFESTLGDILIELNTEKAPMTAANFILLAEGKMPNVADSLKDKPYFDGLIFHRVIPGFMIQSGDPAATGMGGPGYAFPNEVSEELTHEKGVISMANSGPNTNGSQFFITVEATPQLNGGYSVFGKVLEGQSIADSISNVERDETDKPKTTVTINAVTIIRVGKEFKDWDALAAFDAGKAKFESDQKVAQEEAMKAAEEARLKSEAFAAEIATKYPNAKTSESGLIYIVETVGKGAKPKNGDMVNVHYAGYFADGRLFDTSIKSLAQATEGMYNPQREPYDPMAVPYGPDAQMIPGFKEGMMLLNIGGKAKIILPPSLAYGEQGAGGMIPPYAWLIFDIELVSIAKPQTQP